MGEGSRETLFGAVVDDPFRWLEVESDETREWQDAQNRATDAYFAARPDMTALRARVAELLRIGFCEAPFVAVDADPSAKRAFYTRREGTAQQPRLVVRERNEERTLLDGEALSADATDAVDWWYPSPRGTRLAWGRSTAGSEQSVLHVRDVATGEDLPLRIEGTQHCTVAWTSEDAFYYSRHAPGEAYDARIYFHELGRDPKNDPLVFGEGREKTDAPQPIVSPCGRWLVIVVQQGWSKSEIWLRDLHDSSGTFTPIATGEDAMFDAIVRRDALYVLTNSGAPRYRLFAVDWENPSRAAWREVIAEQADVLSSVAITSRRIVASYLRDASSVVIARARDREQAREIALPAIGTASVVSSPDDDDVFVSFTSFVVPLGAWRLNHAGDALEPWALVSQAAPTNIRVERRFAQSKDGTRVPMFVVKKENQTPATPSRTVLYGYGGFNVNQTPAFSARALAFVERGGTWASAILRGGGEYGEAWHQAGMLANKQNVFDDYFACAENLLTTKTTTREALAAVGGSNGGLLVTAAVTQHPELFAAGIALVPLTDMLRYHRFRLGAFWIAEYGSPDEADAFNVLYKYSPYHHVAPNTRYPSMLFWAAESDSRVDPMHARKMAAMMQEKQQAPASSLVLLRVETKAGHGMGKPTAKIADQLAAEIAFLEEETNPARVRR